MFRMISQTEEFEKAIRPLFVDLVTYVANVLPPSRNSHGLYLLHQKHHEVIFIKEKDCSVLDSCYVFKVEFQRIL